MANCCSSINNLGCIGFCDTIETGVNAQTTATYTIYVAGWGYRNIDFDAGDPINFANPFNEDMITIFQIKRGSTIIEDADGNDCFQVLTQIEMPMTPTDCPCPASSTGLVLQITAADFTGSTYTNSNLVGATADTGFLVYADEGSGTLLKEGDGYTFNSVTGTITATAGNYRIQII